MVRLKRILKRQYLPYFVRFWFRIRISKKLRRKSWNSMGKNCFFCKCLQNSSNSNRNRMFDTNDILNITIRANIQLLWLLSLKTKICYEIWCRCFWDTLFKIHSTSSKPNHTDEIDGYLLDFFFPFLWNHFTVFVFGCMRVCLPHFICSYFVRFVWNEEFWSKWIDFFFLRLGFFSYLYLSPHSHFCATCQLCKNLSHRSLWLRIILII